MTQLQLYRKVKSLAWRRNLTENIKELETDISDYLIEKGSDRIVIAGYKVMLIDEKLMLEKAPVISLKQLKFSFFRKN